MISLYGGTGLGSNGTGMGAGGSGGLSVPQLLAMLHGGGGMQPPSNPFQQGGAPTPMANYIGAPPGGGMMPRPMMPPVAGNPAPQGFGGPAPGGGGTQGLMQLLASLKGGQTGVAPGNPNGQPSVGVNASPDMLAAQMAGNQPLGAQGSPTQPLAPAVNTGGPPVGGINPGIMDWLRQLMMFSGGAGGAPGGV